MAEAIEGVPPASQTPDLAWIDDLAAWYRAAYPSLLRFAFYVNGDAAAAEDAIQETFNRLHRRRGRLGSEELNRYARKIILNLRRSGLRRVAVERRLGARVASPVAHIVQHNDGHVWAAILSLSPRQRAVIALKFYEDMKEQDIATALGMSLGSVKKHTDRALTKLRDQLGERERP